MRYALLMLILLSTWAPAAIAQSLHPRLLDAGAVSGLPMVVPNDNRTPAGILLDEVLHVNLEVVWADWRIETPDRPGLKVTAIAEVGQAPMIPAPLLRFETGTEVRVQIHNILTDSTITVFGLHTHPVPTPDSLVVRPGETGTVHFTAGAPGTYLYYVRLGAHPAFGFGTEREQLAGAFIVDPEGGSPPDRVMVLNIGSFEADSTEAAVGYVEALTINGLSWPFTEREHPAVGDTLRWRVINASRRNHPMHLHGFFYDVTSLGNMLADAVYAPEDRRTAVTEFMRGRTTMGMEWVPTRPGKWLFHCHLSFHVTSEIRLPGAAEHDPDGPMTHMAGLVIGIEVQPGPTDLVEDGEPALVRLYVNEYADDAPVPMGFTLDPSFTPDSANHGRPGEMLIFQQYQPTYVTVENRMSEPTGIHWHGLELDSWADGVPGYSASNGKVSPVIAPGASFTYKLSLMRPGTFIYHTHLDDIHQITGGLYGPLLVFPPGETYDPETDHVYTVSWKTPDPRSPDDLDMNGRTAQPTQYADVGETHRIRVINIALAGNITARMMQDEKPVPLLAFAKDGAELPDNQKRPVEVSPAMGVGETADFLFTPTQPGTYELLIGYRRYKWRQVWEVRAPAIPAGMQISLAVQAAPEAARVDATVQGYDTDGKFVTLREGSNEMVCIAPNPASKRFEVSCHHTDLEPFFERGRELRAAGITGKERTQTRWDEIAAGTLPLPAGTTNTILTGTGFDPDTGEIIDPFTRWVVYMPDATAASTGLSERPVGPGSPWVMFAGTPGAHIMITPPRSN